MGSKFRNLKILIFFTLTSNFGHLGIRGGVLGVLGGDKYRWKFIMVGLLWGKVSYDGVIMEGVGVEVGLNVYFVAKR